VTAHETGRSRARRPTLGYAVVLLGAALFVTSCFLPYYGVAGERSVSLYDQLLVAQGGGLELGAILFLFGGVATVVVVAFVGLTRGERPSLRAFLAGGRSVVTHLARLAAPGLKGTETLDSASRDQLVLMDEAAQDVASSHALDTENRC
jgi:hypothetical protein